MIRPLENVQADEIDEKHVAFMYACARVRVCVCLYAYSKVLRCLRVSV